MPESVTVKQTRGLYRTLSWIALAASVFVLIRIAPNLYKPEYLPSDDYVPYWAGGRLNLHGEDPYDPNNVERLQISAGGIPSGSYTISIMLNPPWAVSLVMPFGLMNYQISRLSWLVFSVVLILASSQLLWRIYSKDTRRRWIAILVAFLFAPTISVLEVGQITAVVLLGISGFLFFSIYRRNDWVASVFIALASIKPQAAFLFWLALLFWIIKERRWRLVVSAAITISALTMIAVLTNHQIIQQYLISLRSYQIADWANPTIGSYLRYFIFGTSYYWIQFIAPLLGGFWIVFRWYKNRASWNWLEELPIALLISQITTAYTWTYDLVVLVPIIIMAASLMQSDWKPWPGLILTGFYLVINILDLVLHMKLSDFWFIWVAPCLLIWYLLVLWKFPQAPAHEALAA